MQTKSRESEQIVHTLNCKVLLNKDLGWKVYVVLLVGLAAHMYFLVAALLQGCMHGSFSFQLREQPAYLMIIIMLKNSCQKKKKKNSTESVRSTNLLCNQSSNKTSDDRLSCPSLAKLADVQNPVRLLPDGEQPPITLTARLQAPGLSDA